MNKVYQISNKIYALMLFIIVALGISSCSSYQPRGYESDGVYYNPNIDKTYDETRQQNNQVENNPNEIKIGNPYFDAQGNGAEQFYYDDVNDSTTDSEITIVKVNDYSLGGYNYFGNNNYELSYSNSTQSWGKNNGIEVNVWNNYSSYYSPWSWNSFYRPWYGGSFGLSIGWGWNNWYGYPNFYGAYGWNNWYGYPNFYGRYGYPSYYYGWDNWYGYPSYYGRYGWNRPRGIYAQPGNRYGNNLNYSINSNRPVAGRLNARNNQISNGIRPTRSSGVMNRGVRPTVNQGRINNNIRPTREVRPTVNQGRINNNIRPTREYNPSYNTRPTRNYQQTQPRNYNNSRPSYSSPSSNRGSSMNTGSFGSGSRGGSIGGGAIRGGRR